jgi:hypothetical protein
LKLTDSWREVKATLDSLTEERAKAIEDLQQYATRLQSGQVAPAEPVYKEISVECPENPDDGSFYDSALSMRSSYQNLDSLLSEQSSRMEEIQRMTSALRTKRGEDGELIVEYPANFDDVMEYALEQDSYRRENDTSYAGDQVNWLEVYRAKESIENQDTKLLAKRRKIRLLDRKIREKEQQLAEVRSRVSAESRSTDSFDPTFVTKGTRVRRASPELLRSSKHSRPSQNEMRSRADEVTMRRAGGKGGRGGVEDRTKGDRGHIVQRNIDNAKNYKSKLYLTERLSESEKNRLSQLTEDETLALVPLTTLISECSLSRLGEIDETLKTYIPEEQWEEKSIIYSVSSRSRGRSSKKKPSSTSSSSNSRTSEPKEPALQEEKERRETYSRLKRVNQSLYDLQKAVPNELTEEDLNVSAI